MDLQIRVQNDFHYENGLNFYALVLLILIIIHLKLVRAHVRDKFQFVIQINKAIIRITG